MTPEIPNDGLNRGIPRSVCNEWSYTHLGKKQNELFFFAHFLQHNNSFAIPESHSDLERLKELLFEITECKDDSQQRGWAIHDDEKAISDILEEILQILVRLLDNCT